MVENCGRFQKEGICFDAFPETLKDAILATENLGICYLWIDAFCILQDEDNKEVLAAKQRELAKMADIYRNATVTIAASRASRANAGFLFDRQPIGSDSPNSVFQVRYNKGMENDGTIIMYPFAAEPVEPLDTRAWAMQERLLSRRIIDFGCRSTSWICCTDTFETLTDGWSSISGVNSERSYDLFRSIQSLTPQIDPNMASTLWHRAVQEYSSREITKCQDRLPAIAAVAGQFKQYLGSKYLAGLWYQHLALDLLWEAAEQQLRVKQTDYIGPSWSWVSTNRPVRYKSYMVHEEDGTPVILPTLDSSFRALDGKVQLYSNFELGQVLGGSLKVSARYQPALWRPGNQIDKTKQIGTLWNEKHRVELPAHFIVDSQSFPQHEATEQATMQIYLMVVIANPDYNFSMSEGYSTQFEFATSAGAGRWRRKLSRNHDADSKRYHPSERPFANIKGIVLRKVDRHTFSRLGVFELDHHYSEMWKQSLRSRSRNWNDCFSEFHAHTKFMMEGQVKEFIIV